MAGTFETRNLSVSINRRPREVYDFASVPENFPQRSIGSDSIDPCSIIDESPLLSVFRLLAQSICNGMRVS